MTNLPPAPGPAPAADDSLTTVASVAQQQIRSGKRPTWLLVALVGAVLIYAYRVLTVTTGTFEQNFLNGVPEMLGRRVVTQAMRFSESGLRMDQLGIIIVLAFTLGAVIAWLITRQK